MMRRDSRRARTLRLAVIFALGTGALATVAGPSSAQVTSVVGSALGASIPELTIFGGIPPGVPFGPIPSVTLAADASNSPQSASAQSVSAIFGPASVFSSGPVTVSTEGTLGAGGSVTSSTDIQNVNTSQNEVFTATRLESTCTASETGATGSTTITDGTVILQDPDPDTTGEAGEQVVNLPVNPPPNTTHEGTVANVNDNFRATFNEQIDNPDGSLTVNAYHLELRGPTAFGHLYVGQVVCDVTATQTTTTQPPGVTTTQPPGVTTTQPPRVTTTRPSTTTTTRPSTTTTTRPSTTTTVLGPTTTRAGGGDPGTTTPRGTGTLVRTGSALESLVVLGLLTLVLGALLLIGLGSRTAPVGGSWAQLMRQASAWRRARRQWHRHHRR